MNNTFKNGDKLTYTLMKDNETKCIIIQRKCIFMHYQLVGEYYDHECSLVLLEKTFFKKAKQILVDSNNLDYRTH